VNTTLRSIGDGVVTTDIAGRITSINKAAETIVGWSGEDVVGKPFWDVFRLISESDQQPVSDPVRTVLDTGKIIGIASDTALLNKNGEEISIADSAAPIKNEQGVMLASSSCFAISARKKRGRTKSFS
jgi:PAS domain S-box-containing protein